MYIISIEAIDGSGKTTLAENIKKEIEKRIEQGSEIYKKVAFVKFPSEHFFSQYSGKKETLSENEIRLLQDRDKLSKINQLEKEGYKVALCDRAEVTQMVYNNDPNPSISSDYIFYIHIELDQAVENINKRKIKDNLGFEEKETLKRLRIKYEDILFSDKYYDKVQVFPFSSLKGEAGNEVIEIIVEKIREKLNEDYLW